MKFGFNQPIGFRGEDVWKCWYTTHIHTTEAYVYYKLTNEPKDSGELISHFSLFVYDELDKIDKKAMIRNWSNQTPHSAQKVDFPSFLTVWGPRRRLDLSSWDSSLNKVTFIIFIWKFEPLHDTTNKMTCAPSEDADQPGHPPNLTKVCAVRMKKPLALSYPMSAHCENSDQNGRIPRLIWGFRWAQRSLCWYCHDAAYFIKHYKRIWYNLDIMWKTAGVVVSPVKVDSYAFHFN